VQQRLQGRRSPALQQQRGLVKVAGPGGGGGLGDQRPGLQLGVLALVGVPAQLGEQGGGATEISLGVRHAGAQQVDLPQPSSVFELPHDRGRLLQVGGRLRPLPHAGGVQGGANWSTHARTSGSVASPAAVDACWIVNGQFSPLSRYSHSGQGALTGSGE